jgi:hypothetical protein
MAYPDAGNEPSLAAELAGKPFPRGSAHFVSYSLLDSGLRKEATSAARELKTLAGDAP